MKGNRQYSVVNQEDPFFNPSWKWYEKVPKETVKIKAYDNTILKGVYIPSIDEKSLNTAIILHGYHSVSTDMVLVAKTYSDLGFKVLLPDLRGHGLSEGIFTSFGHYEKYDLKRWINFVLRTYGSTDSILLDGVSMGASTVMLASTLQLPENVKFIVADSGFPSMNEVFIKSFKPKIGLLFLPGVSLITYYFHHFFLGQIKPIHEVRKSKIPIFFIHGTQDELIPFDMAKKLYATSKSPFKELYSVENAKHALGYKDDKAGIDARLKEILPDFFDIKKSFLKQTK